jgi:ergothioneine biosynthesis protein EgtB
MTVLNKYLIARNRSEELCVDLTIEDYIPQSAEFASPPKWHLAHTTWFFEEMILKTYLPNYNIFDKDFSFLFNSYYNAIGQRLARPQRGLITRPGVDRVYEYRKYVDKSMTTLLNSKYSKAIEELTILGIHHEQQHQELLITDLKYTFSHNPTYPKYGFKPWINDHNEETGWQIMSEGIYEIGHSGSDFCFDNELGNHKVFLESFEISKSLVTNGEYLEFVKKNGYSNSFYWLDEGWTWIKSNSITSPLYWYNVNDEWFYYTLGGLVKIDLDAILSHISFYEAAAYATFMGARLATEFEWEASSEHFKWGKRWEWTNSAYLPYPRFKIKEGAVGEYNGKFMINQMVLRGASVATSEGHSRKAYRNFFHPQMQWQFSGIRLVK